MSFINGEGKGGGGAGGVRILFWETLIVDFDSNFLLKVNNYFNINPKKYFFFLIQFSFDHPGSRFTQLYNHSYLY